MEEPQHVTSTHPIKAIDQIPTEIWTEVAQALPCTSLRYFVLACRKFYEAGNSYLYRAVCFYPNHHYIPRGESSPRSYFGIHRDQAWLVNPESSSRVKDSIAFARTITENAKLRRHIVGASFGWSCYAVPDPYRDATKTCLKDLKESLRVLHIDLPDFNTKFALTSNITYLDIEYPSRERLFDDYDEYDEVLHDGLRDIIYSIFTIPTLRHLSLHHARTLQAMQPLPETETWRVGTSNITSLALFNSVPLSRDLAEMLTWPVALMKLYHEITADERKFVRDTIRETSTTPLLFAQGLRSQRHVLQELIHDNGSQPYYDHGIETFGDTLRDFTALKRLCVSRECLVEDLEFAGQPLYQTLPPNLEEVWLNLASDDLFDESERSYLIQAVREIAIHKENWFPSLKTVMVWGSSSCYSDYHPHTKVPANDKLREALGLDALFGSTGIRLECIVGNPVSGTDWIG